MKNFLYKDFLLENFLSKDLLYEDFLYKNFLENTKISRAKKSREEAGILHEGISRGAPPLYTTFRPYPPAPTAGGPLLHSVTPTPPAGGSRHCLWPGQEHHGS